MAVTVATLEAILTANTRDFDRAMHKSDSTMKKVGNTAGIAGAAIAAGLGVAAKIGFDEFREGQKVTAQTNAVLKSTGGVANVTEKHLDKLSRTLMRKSGVDDEAIKSGGNLLLTFTKIRNQAGEGNDIFDQTTKATLDLSVAMGKDLNSSAILVGKALNDPVRGATALRRAGVQLTESQTDLIKELIGGKKASDNLADSYSGKLSVAQLEQINKLEKLGFGWREIAQKMDLEFTPAQQRAMDSAERGGHVLEAQKMILKELTTEFGGSAEAAGKTFSGQLNILRETFANLMADIVGGVFPTLVGFAKHLQTGVDWLQNHEKAAKALFLGLGVLATGLIAVKVATLAMNLAFIATPWGATILAAAALSIGLVVLWKRSEEFRQKVNELWALLRLSPLGLIIQSYGELAQRLTGAESRTQGFIDVLRVAWNLIKLSPLAQLISHLDDIASAVTRAKNRVVEFGTSVVEMYATAIKKLDPLVDAFKEMAHWIGKVVSGIKWLIDHIPDIPGGSLIDKFKGDPADPTMTLPPQGPVGSGPADISPRLWDELAGSRRFGLVMTSGYRPGAITKHGTPSDHGVYPSHAIDVAGSANAMASFFRWLIGQRDVKQAFYDPLGSIFGGVLSNYREGGHSDHVHVATYDKGGWLKPGLTLAANYTGKPEPVGLGAAVVHEHHYHAGVVQDQRFLDYLRQLETRYRRNNAKPGFST